MKQFLSTELVKALGAALDAPNVANHVSGLTGVSIDSRTTEAGNCFFAISGENFDGHDYVCDAFAKGAVCAVVDEKFDDGGSPDRYLLKVEDTVKALGDLAREYRRTCRAIGQGCSRLRRGRAQSAGSPRREHAGDDRSD